MAAHKKPLGDEQANTRKLLPLCRKRSMPKFNMRCIKHVFFDHRKLASLLIFRLLCRVCFRVCNKQKQPIYFEFSLPSFTYTFLSECYKMTRVLSLLLLSFSGCCCTRILFFSVSPLWIRRLVRAQKCWVYVPSCLCTIALSDESSFSLYAQEWKFTTNSTFCLVKTDLVCEW